MFEALANATDFAAWWAPATGSAADGELRITFDGLDDPLVLRVKLAARPSAVSWEVLERAFLPCSRIRFGVYYAQNVQFYSCIRAYRTGSR